MSCTPRYMCQTRLVCEADAVMVYDDVFTAGSSLNAVVMRLKASGAVKVYGLTLARARWRLNIVGK